MSGAVEEEYVPEEKGTILYGISQHFAEEIQPHFDQVLKQMDLASPGSSSDVKLTIQPSQKKGGGPSIITDITFVKNDTKEQFILELKKNMPSMNNRLQDYFKHMVHSLYEPDDGNI